VAARFELSGRFDLPGPGESRRLRALLTRPAPAAARGLLGQVLLRRRGRQVLAARIVETEAYLPAGDAAAHVFRGRTPRNAPLYGPPGNIYIYLVYGRHHCLNLAVDQEGVPGCVLIRAAELRVPGGALPDSAGRGPGRLCRTLRLDTRQSGTNVFVLGAGLTLREGRPPRGIGVATRIGIRYSGERYLRFFDSRSPAVSRRPARPLTLV
jgi:DNA-3-methyladenine glycosylase